MVKMAHNVGTKSTDRVNAIKLKDNCLRFEKNNRFFISFRTGIKINMYRHFIRHQGKAFLFIGKTIALNSLIAPYIWMTLKMNTCTTKALRPLKNFCNISLIYAFCKWFLLMKILIVTTFSLIIN